MSKNTSVSTVNESHSKNKSIIFIVKTLFDTSILGKLDILYSVILTIIFSLGNLLTVNSAIDINTLGKKSLLANIAGAIVLFSFFLILIIQLKIITKKYPRTKPTIFLENISSIKMWFTFMALIFTAYIPFIFIGQSVLTPDSWSSINQSQGTENLSNHHPIAFTTFISIFIHIGLIFNNLQFGLFLFSLTQSIILAMIFAAIVVYIRNEKFSRSGIVLALAFYALLPINAVAGIIMWKDILFAGFGLLLLLLIRKIYIEKERFLTRNNVIMFIVLAFLFSIWRNNGIYVYVLFCLLAVLFSHKILLNKKYILLLCGPIVIFMIYYLTLISFTKPGQIAEALSVPIQQIARTVKYHGDNLTVYEKNTINELLPFSELTKKYNPNLSDPVKFSFNNEVFKNNPYKYAKLWVKLSVKYEKTYISAFLYNTYGYFYPFRHNPYTVTDILSDNTDNFNASTGYSDNPFSSGNKQVLIEYKNALSSSMPLIRNIGFYSVLMVILSYISIIRRRTELTGVFILLFSLYITTILGPVNGEFRYLYLFVVAVPFVLASALSTRSTKSS